MSTRSITFFSSRTLPGQWYRMAHAARTPVRKIYAGLQNIMSLCAGAPSRAAGAVYRWPALFLANSRQPLCSAIQFVSNTIFDKLRNPHEHW